MSFILSDEANAYLARLNTNKKAGILKTKFDFYYLCLLVGFNKGELVSGDPKGEVFIDVPPKEHTDSYKEILGVLLSSEIKRRGVEVKDRNSMEKIMMELLDPNSVNQLSEDGARILNRYAAKGFEEIIEALPEPNTRLDTFLIKYYSSFFDNKNQKK